MQIENFSVGLGLRIGLLGYSRDAMLLRRRVGLSNVSREFR